MHNLRGKIQAAAKRRREGISTTQFCQLRGDWTGDYVDCSTCSGKTKLKVFECPFHSEGTSSKMCEGCEKKVGPTRIPPPTTLDFFLSGRCNLRCHFCYVADSNCQIAGPNLVRSKKIADWFLKSTKNVEREVRINFFGGEPLLEWDDLRGVVEHVRSTYPDRKCRFTIVTNVTLLDEAKLRYLMDHDFGIQLSIDGCPEAQDMQRVFQDGSGTSHIVYDNARRLILQKPNTSVRSTITPRTVHLLAESVRYLHEQLGSLHISPVHASGVFWSEEKLRVYREQLIEVTKWWTEKVRQGTWIHLYFIEKAMRTLSVNPVPVRSCGAGHGMIAVDTHGYIWPCHRFAEWDPSSQFCLGHIDRGGYTNLKMWDLISHVKMDNCRTWECDGCEARLMCQTFCFYETNLNAPNGVCSLYPQGPSAHHNCELFRAYFRAWSIAHRTLLNEGNKLYAEKVNKAIGYRRNH